MGKQSRNEAEELLDMLLDWALANRNTPYEFVCCYTYEIDLKSRKRRVPKVIADAKRFLGESVDHLEVVAEKR